MIILNLPLQPPGPTFALSPQGGPNAPIKLCRRAGMHPFAYRSPISLRNANQHEMSKRALGYRPGCPSLPPLCESGRHQTLYTDQKKIFFLVALRGMPDLSSPTRNGTLVSCSGILNHWTVREGPGSKTFFNSRKILKVKLEVASCWQLYI